MNLYITKLLRQRLPFISRIFHGYATWMLFDIPVILGAFVLALLARSLTAHVDLSTGLLFTLATAAAFTVANACFGIYRRYWSYATADDAIALIAASTLATAVVLALDLLLYPRPLPRSVVLVGGFFAMAGQTIIRYRRRLFSGLRWSLRHSLYRLLADGTRTLIVGAGEGGQLLAFRMQMTPAGRAYHVVGFVDDDPAKQDKIIHGLPVLGRCDQIEKLTGQHQIELIIIAIHNISQPRLRALIDRCLETEARIRLLPDPFSLINASTHLPLLREVTVDDLLDRETHTINAAQVSSLLAGKKVLVTGAAGSIGSELCRQIMAFGPRQLLMLDNNETGLHDLATAHFTDRESIRNPQSPIRNPQSEIPQVVPIVGDVTNLPKMQDTFRKYQPDIVFHAAAYKHVPLMEDQPEEAARVNILGTRIVAALAARFGTERFVLISTDKAVNPCSVMGVTKRICELLITTADPLIPQPARAGASSGHPSERSTLFTAVRFGNVLGSRGSVVPTFQRQIDQGGPVTVTHPDMTRYFMSIPEAVSLIIEAATLTTGGDIFMLDMGERIRIDDLARRLIRLRGLRPDVDIPIVYTGPRPGEKMHEELIGAGEIRHPTPHPHIFRIACEHPPNGQALQPLIDSLAALITAQGNAGALLALREALSAGSSGLTGLEPLPTPWDGGRSTHHDLHQAVARELARSRRYGHRCSLCMIHLNATADPHKRYAGRVSNGLLWARHRSIRQALREADIVLCLDAGRFAVILPETDSMQALTVAGRLQAALATAPFSNSDAGQTDCTFSLGVATYPEDAQNATKLISLANSHLQPLTNHDQDHT